MREKNQSTRRKRPVAGQLVWLSILVVLALGVWPGRAILASTLMSRKISGEVHLQGRLDHSDIDVQMQTQPGINEVQGANVSLSPAAVTPEGAFNVDAQGAMVITAGRPGYLDAQATVTESDAPINLGPTTLYGGEVTGDNVIDISDLAYLGANFHTSDAQADINGDGQVDILDLSISAANFSMRGPTPWGE